MVVVGLDERLLHGQIAAGRQLLAADIVQGGLDHVSGLVQLSLLAAERVQVLGRSEGK